jgi:hypothetical protein
MYFSVDSAANIVIIRGDHRALVGDLAGSPPYCGKRSLLETDAMPIKHPVDGEISYSVSEASVWLTERGLPMSEPTLASKRTNGGDGPRCFKIGKPVYYRESALREYLLSKITPEVRSTSELKAAKQLLIEDKSETHSNGGKH